jgi:hypothetical protein
MRVLCLSRPSNKCLAGTVRDSPVRRCLARQGQEVLGPVLTTERTDRVPFHQELASGNGASHRTQKENGAPLLAKYFQVPARFFGEEIVAEGAPRENPHQRSVVIAGLTAVPRVCQHVIGLLTSHDRRPRPRTARPKRGVH